MRHTSKRTHRHLMNLFGGALLLALSLGTADGSPRVGGNLFGPTTDDLSGPEMTEPRHDALAPWLLIAEDSGSDSTAPSNPVAEDSGSDSTAPSNPVAEDSGSDLRGGKPPTA